MLEQLERNWWILALRGGASVGFGLFALLWPGATLGAAIALYAAYAMANGLLVASTAARQRRGAPRLLSLWLEATCGLALGCAAWLWPDLTGGALVDVIASWAVLTGGFEFVSALRLREELEGEWLLAAAGLLSLAFGIALAAQPVTRSLALVWLLGGYAIAFGLVMAGLGIDLRLHAPEGAPTRGLS